MTKLESAKKLVRDKGEESTAASIRRFLNDIKPGTTTVDKVNGEVKLVARAVMRNPDEGALGILCDVHAKLREQFANESDEAISWMLGGTKEYGRGTFKDAQSFRDFLNEDPRHITPSRLITGIETTLTSIGYRSVGIGTAPRKPNDTDAAGNHLGTPDERKVQSKVNTMLENRNVSLIDTVYVNRGKDVLRGGATTLDSDIVMTPEDVSEVSEADEGKELPENLMGAWKYQKYNDAQGLSWVAAGVESNVPVRAHTSGSAPLTLAALTGVLGTDPNPRTLSDDEVRLAAGALIIPSYLRGDYHSVAESYAGIEYFIAQTNLNHDPQNAPEPRQIQPAEAFQGAMEMMANSSSKAVDQKTGLSISDAIREVKNDLSQHIIDVESQQTAQQAPSRNP